MYEDIEAGTHLKSSRALYTHHGLYIGNNQVIHYGGWAEGILKSGPIEITTIEKFRNGNDLEIVEHPNPKYSKKEAVKRAKDRLGEHDYCVISNNCEHFVNWCIEGEHWSEQAFISLPYNSIKQDEIEKSINDKKKLDDFHKKLSKYF